MSLCDDFATVTWNGPDVTIQGVLGINPLDLIGTPEPGRELYPIYRFKTHHETDEPHMRNVVFRRLVAECEIRMVTKDNIDVIIGPHKLMRDFYYDLAQHCDALLTRTM